MNSYFERKGIYFFRILMIPFFVLYAFLNMENIVVQATRYNGSIDTNENENKSMVTEENVEQIENDYYKNFYDTVNMNEISEDLNEITASYGRENAISYHEFYE